MRRLLALVLSVPLLACVATGNLGKDDTGGGGTDDTDDGGGTDGDRMDVGGHDGACAPKEGDTSCQTCEKADCCEVYEACYAVDQCVCIMTCLHEGHGLDACINNCGADGGRHVDLMTCADGHCSDAGCP